MTEDQSRGVKSITIGASRMRLYEPLSASNDLGSIRAVVARHWMQMFVMDPVVDEVRLGHEYTTRGLVVACSITSGSHAELIIRLTGEIVRAD